MQGLYELFPLFGAPSSLLLQHGIFSSGFHPHLFLEASCHSHPTQWCSTHPTHLPCPFLPSYTCYHLLPQQLLPYMVGIFFILPLSMVPSSQFKLPERCFYFFIYQSSEQYFQVINEQKFEFSFVTRTTRYIFYKVGICIFRVVQNKFHFFM